MKKLLIPTLLAFLPFVIFYFAAVFVNLKFDFRSWTESERFFVSMFSIFFGYILFMFGVNKDN